MAVRRNIFVGPAATTPQIAAASSSSVASGSRPTAVVISLPLLFNKETKGV